MKIDRSGFGRRLPDQRQAGGDDRSEDTLNRQKSRPHDDRSRARLPAKDYRHGGLPFHRYLDSADFRSTSTLRDLRNEPVFELGSMNSWTFSSCGCKASLLLTSA